MVEWGKPVYGVRSCLTESRINMDGKGVTWFLSTTGKFPRQRQFQAAIARGSPYSPGAARSHSLLQAGQYNWNIALGVSRIQHVVSPNILQRKGHNTIEVVYRWKWVLWTGQEFYDDSYITEPASLAGDQTSQGNITTDSWWFPEANVF